jgi:hypothetical protein
VIEIRENWLKKGKEAGKEVLIAEGSAAASSFNVN